MGVAFFVLCWIMLVLVFGMKMLALFGLVVAAATFMYPCGLIALVLAGVALLFLLRPQHHQLD